jgi:hypothetical protein
MRLSQSLTKSYFCILEFFKQIGLEKNLWLLLVLQIPTSYCWKAAEIYVPTLIISGQRI